jgi:hypothetical protein
MVKLQAMDDKYANYIRNLPFLVTQRLLKMQLSRLRIIKTALTEKLEDHPLSSAHSASFSNDTIVNEKINSMAAAAGISPVANAPAGFTPQSGGASENPSQSATRPGSDGLSGRGQ